jgi:D-alanine--poly(phosphoribitol) ligase subunit 1
MSGTSFRINQRLSENFKRFSDRTAFFIRGEAYSYEQFRSRVAVIQDHLVNEIPSWQEYIGVLCKDHIDTYASIFALWLSGKAFVPLNPLNPAERNAEIKKRMNLQFILCAGSPAGLDNETGKIAIDTLALKDRNHTIADIVSPDDQDAYVLFTSGSTGRPKGVRISRRNLDTFYSSYTRFCSAYEENDRHLQIYDLSFDGSVPCYLVPLCTGASVYTVPQEEIKYLYALKLITDHKLTVLKMTPSTLNYLRPFFDRIHLPHVKVCLFGGEALPLELTLEWMKCIPNAILQNAYGPTEATIDSLMYNFNKDEFPGKSLNGIISLGKGFGDFGYTVIDQSRNPVKPGETGELCLHGNQVMSGYWDDEEKTSRAFVEFRSGKDIKRFYRTGDLVSADSDGYYYFHGRIDEQVQIQGFRVEPGEIEKHSSDVSGTKNLAAVSFNNRNGNRQLALFIAGEQQPVDPILKYLEEKLPHYMVPAKVFFIQQLPELSSGKTDRRKLSEIASDYENQ